MRYSPTSSAMRERMVRLRRKARVIIAPLSRRSALVSTRQRPCDASVKMRAASARRAARSGPDSTRNSTRSICPRRSVSVCAAGRSMMMSEAGAAGSLRCAGMWPAISSETRRSSIKSGSGLPGGSGRAGLTKAACKFPTPPVHVSRIGSEEVSSSRKFWMPIRSMPMRRKVSALPISALSLARGREAVVSMMGMMWTGRVPRAARSSGRIVSGRLPAGAETTKSVSCVSTSVNRSKLASTARLARRMEK